MLKYPGYFNRKKTKNFFSPYPRTLFFPFLKSQTISTKMLICRKYFHIPQPEIKTLSYIPYTMSVTSYKCKSNLGTSANHSTLT